MHQGGENMFCKNCGKTLEDDEIICGNCGTKIKMEQGESIQCNNTHTVVYYGQSDMTIQKNKKNLFRSGIFVTALILCSIHILCMIIGALTETGGYGIILNYRAGIRISGVGGMMITLLTCIPTILILIGLWIAFFQLSGGISVSVVGNMIRWIVTNIGYAILLILLLFFGIAGNELLHKFDYYIRISNAKDTILAVSFIGILIVLLIAILSNLYYAKINQVLCYARKIMGLPPAGRSKNGAMPLNFIPPKTGYICVIWILMAIGNLGGVFIGIGTLDKIGSLFLVIAYILLTVWISDCRSRLESEFWE